MASLFFVPNAITRHALGRVLHQGAINDLRATVLTIRYRAMARSAPVGDERGTDNDRGSEARVGNRAAIRGKVVLEVTILDLQIVVRAVQRAAGRGGDIAAKSAIDQ